MSPPSDSKRAMLPLSELREVVTIALAYVEGYTHYSVLCGPIERGLYWSRVYGVHPEIRALLRDWFLWIDQTWNEWGHYPQSLSEDELRARLARDLGVIPPDSATLRTRKPLRLHGLR